MDFETHRPRLRAVAYRMLGSLSEADDAVQETWLRASRADTTEVANIAGWLTTITARVCLDLLRRRAARPEEPLPDPVVTAPDGPTALELARMFQPEIAFLDIGLPAMDGYELARHLRHVPGIPPDLKLIAVTGYGLESDRQRTSAAGLI